MPNDCEFCKGKSESLNNCNKIAKFMSMDLEDDHLYVYTSNNGYEYDMLAIIQINYCPFCGKKLNKEK